MSINKHTPKSRLLLLLMMLMLVISAVTITKPLTAYAEDDNYNGDKGADSNKVGTGTIGASTTNTAFYMYIVDSDGHAETPGVLICNTNSGINKKYKKIEKFNFLTKQSSGMLSAPISLAGGASMYASFSDAPYPVLFEDDQWKSNGDKVRQWLMDPVDNGDKYWFVTILRNCITTKFPPGCEYGDVWGKCEEDLKGGDYYVVVQPVAMLHVNTTSERLMTTDGWIKTLGNYQHPLITGAMYNCMILEYSELGVKVPTEIKASYYGDYEKLKSTGYGIHIIHINFV